MIGLASTAVPASAPVRNARRVNESPSVLFTVEPRVVSLSRLPRTEASADHRLTDDGACDIGRAAFCRIYNRHFPNRLSAVAVLSVAFPRSVTERTQRGEAISAVFDCLVIDDRYGPVPLRRSEAQRRKLVLRYVDSTGHFVILRGDTESGAVRSSTVKEAHEVLVVGECRWAAPGGRPSLP